jgi:hypothetical protein
MALRLWALCVVQSEKADVLVELGHTTAAMDVFAQRGDWERVWEMAAKERVSAAVLAKFAAMRVQQLLEECSGGWRIRGLVCVCVCVCV